MYKNNMHPRDLGVNILGTTYPGNQPEQYQFAQAKYI